VEDPEEDGTRNRLEYVLNGNPLEAYLEILRRLDATAEDTTQVFQYGSSLSGWTDEPITNPTAPEVALGTVTGG